ncbi:Elongation factor 1-alpha [Porphyridium purpureum]|uniref:Elongation factor 1-alpha n=1 Tax=Porphyridium purpureum TaxID=35688 RepID=A0A5J4YUW5_PORPP|nr:Elongation factor 1-alpha [Porphyridium purpureum]|eukprot:POR5126..scf227_4
MADKKHVSIVICGHVDAGKSTTTGRLIFELGGISDRELDKLKAEADALGKGSFAFAFYMDKSKEERARGVTIACTTKEFYTDSYHYTIIDAPGHRDFIKNMITGASQADVGLLMVPADGNFTTAIAKGDHKAGIVQGQTRQHARLLNLLGVKQLVVGVNKMDCDMAKYGKERFDECANEAKNMLVRVGWKKDFVATGIPVLPLSGWIGDNLIKKSENMAWWAGQDITIEGKNMHVDTLLDCLEKMVTLPTRKLDAQLRMPVSGVYKIKGVGDVLTGRVEQGEVKPGDECIFLPTHTAANACSGKIFSVEMHHKSVPSAGPGDNVGLNVKGLDKVNMPRVGDVMIRKSDSSLKTTKNFTAAVQILDHPGQLKVGYSPIAFVRTGRAACKITAINWRMGKETGGQKQENPPHVQANEMAELVFAPQTPFVVESFKACEGLGRVAIMEGNTVVMLGKVMKVEMQ